MRVRRTVFAVIVVLGLILSSFPAMVLADDYTVVAGDTLFQISAKLLGDGNRYLEIVEATNTKSATDTSYAFI